ncbi:MAG: PorV/PorQ family protein [Candidatus Kapabacteria bacterium]|nr:PorV/PorQ family protein [Candidatus Kapabacteria bacterium]MCX7937584.1 PorV/PorQ family protein [Chlorobiota bacterium]
MCIKGVGKVLVCVATLSRLCWGQTLSPFDFLRTAESARAAGLAGAFVAIAGDASAQLYNPATIPTVPPDALSLTFIKHVLDINSGVAAYCGQMGAGWWGATAAYTSYGQFTRTDALGNAIGTFGAAHFALQVSYANQLDTNVFYGVSLGYVHTAIDRGAASALIATVGLFYQFPLIRTSIGGSIRYFGVQLARMNGESAALPTDIRLGVSHRLRGLPLMVNFSLTRLVEDRMSLTERLRNFAIAGELYLGKSVQLRLGYDNGVRSGQSSVSASPLSGFGVGAGLVFPSLTLDYTLTTLSAPALVHRLSCGLALDTVLKER